MKRTQVCHKCKWWEPLTCLSEKLTEGECFRHAPTIVNCMLPKDCQLRADRTLPPAPTEFLVNPPEAVVRQLTSAYAAIRPITARNHFCGDWQNCHPTRVKRILTPAHPLETKFPDEGSLVPFRTEPAETWFTRMIRRMFTPALHDREGEP